ncbi:hypothetical protein AHMF7605_04365 [Adhaeribacter arboris]|uniref:Bacterial bifunctional deaminase-reductase C-terminal domain-containing protein n=1 Tax=Adhaeribacter arboris TaxID=2072846 RepID=A0A2T2YB99_9BACT|nr:dihydrofolate reductase family protein [Adhaeribacter arboris]PSR52810.1 hypothetical protein AHMF7605_04365 [Adhaeribacter arboris]
MRKLKLYIATSLDGKIARKDDSVDWLPDPNAGEDYGYQNFLAEIDTLVMGYKTYEVCLKLGEWPYEGKTTYVFTRDVTKPQIPAVQLISQNPVEFVKDLLQQEGKDIWLVGGGEINTLLHDAGLIDSYYIAFIPIILGEGIELLPEVRKQQNLVLTQHQVYENGLVMLYLEKVSS